ncbi:NUDIX hydrolase [Streptacidiphilus monticola]|uniref:NUDIX hydrolase n=1 Tax=Streptacidiphilus monticola TaxID=2161674 RepID=A0ABW1G2J1_9ACTN
MTGAPPPDAAVTVAEDERGRIAMVRQRSEVHGELFTLPGGRVEPDESPIAAARRELAEETGLRAAHWTVLGGGPTALLSHSPARLHLFAARGLTPGAPAPEDAARLTLVWLPLAEAVAAVRRGAVSLTGSALGILLHAADRQEGPGA